MVVAVPNPLADPLWPRFDRTSQQILSLVRLGLALKPHSPPNTLRVLDPRELAPSSIMSAVRVSDE
jgi:hypothetical protein